MRWWFLFGLICAFELFAEEKPSLAEKIDETAIEQRCLEMLQSVVPTAARPLHKATTMNFPDGRVIWGLLFDKSELTALVSFHRAPVDVFDYPPNWLSVLVWRDGHWRYQQFLGSASHFDIHRRTDLELQIVQGYCQTERHGGKQSSWQYDAKTKRLVPTGLDDWGPYTLSGDYLCYRRGHERLAHWETTWVYRFADGKRCELLGCLHQDDEGKFAVSFRDKTAKTVKTWAFRPAPEKESRVTVFSAKDEEDLYGEEIAVLELSKTESLSPEHCFELLTGLNAKLLTAEWFAEVPRPGVNRLPISATGAADVVQAFQWP